MQVKFYCDLYVSEDFEEKKEKIIKKIRSNKAQPHVYVLTLATGKQNHLEFYSSLMLKQKSFNNQQLLIVGIANGYDDALYMTQDIVQEVYQKTKDTNIRGYIESKQKEFEKERG